MQDIRDYIESQRNAFEDDLCHLLAIPSVSADSKHRSDVRRAAEWVATRFRELGLQSEIVNTSGQPLVLAESPDVPGAPTVLVYGHYDVQPPDPLSEWITPPFEPTRRDGNIYARGSTDDKGQFLTHVFSTQAWLATRRSLPLKLKFLIEGEEEVGSQGVNEFLEDPASRRRLACDVAVISDTCQFAAGQPAITYGLRGIAYFELRLSGPRQDLHSGTFGGGVTNPANALCKMLSSLIDGQGRIQVPGFYDNVLALSDRERQQFASLPFDERDFMGQIGVEGLSGEASYSTLERRWARPTFDINGIWSGYQGEGAKTVLPARATAKFSFRLVPNQDPHKVAASLATHLRSVCPPGIQMELIDMHGATGVVVPLDSPYMAAASRAIESGFGKAPVYIREGGSIPIVTRFKTSLGVDTLLLGWGLNDDNAHSPNEKFCLADFHRGIQASARLWAELAECKV